MKFIVKIILLGFVVSSSGCSTLKLAYNNADLLLKYYINDYFDLTDQQSEFVDRELTKALTWHRNNELPEYIFFINESKKRITNGLTEPDLRWGYSAFRERYKKTIDFLFPSLLDFFSGLSLQQINQLEKKYAEENQKSEKRNSDLTKEELLHKRADNLVSNLEDWFGDFTDSQIEQIRKMSYDMPNNREIFQKERLRRQQEFIQILKKYRSKNGLKNPLYIYLTDTKSGRSDDYLSYQKNLEDAIYQFALKLDKMLNKEQRRHLFEKIDDYKTMMEELSVR